MADPQGNSLHGGVAYIDNKKAERKDPIYHMCFANSNFRIPAWEIQDKDFVPGITHRAMLIALAPTFNSWVSWYM